MLRAEASASSARSSRNIQDLTPSLAQRMRSRADSDLAAFGRRRSCRGPRWAEARQLFPNKEVAAAGWAGARLAANRDVAGGRLRSANHAIERGPTASAR